jgi:hypothetical protein
VAVGAQHILNHRCEISNPIVIKERSELSGEHNTRIMQKAFRFNLSVVKRERGKEAQMKTERVVFT